MKNPKFIVNSDVQLQILSETGAQISINGAPAGINTANSTDAAQEKHVPVVKVNGDMVTATVGDVMHPSLPEHYIQWVYLQTNMGGYRRDFNPEEDPIALFKLVEGEKPISVYEYCNLHGLWKTEL